MTTEPPAPEADEADEVDEPDTWDRVADWLWRRGAVPALAVVTLAMIAIYAGVFRGEIAGDDLSFHMAESARLADCLRAGDFDFWNWSANAGFASAYYYQVLPQLASALPAALFGHHLFFFQLSVFLPLVFAPAAAYRGLRVMGATPWQSLAGALAVGFLNGESRWGTGNAGTFNVGLYTQTWALALFPLALGHTVRWATRGLGLAPAIAWGAFMTLCHPFAGASLAFAVFVGWLSRPLIVLAESMRGTPARWFRAWLGELGRLTILGGCLLVTWSPIWLPLLIDYDGFGGFPHRVNDEIGPGFKTLGAWFVHGAILDFARPVVLTWTLPIVAVFARPGFTRWLWAPTAYFALSLGLGPHMGKTDDDLFPPVRFLGAMQVVLALAIGSGALWLVGLLWNAPEGSRLHRPLRTVLRWATPARSHAWAREVPLQYAMRTALASLVAVLVVLLTLPGAYALASRVHVLGDYPASHGDQLLEITRRLQAYPPGRKQVGPGAENHWWNLLSYEYGRRPSLLMMGGGGLQASPNYDYLWSTSKEFTNNAWVYAAPYLVFQKSSASSMPIGEELFATKDYQVRRLPAPGLVSAVQVTGVLPPGRKPAHAEALTWFRSDEPKHDRVRAYAGSGDAGPPANGAVGRVFTQDSPGDDADLYAEVDATTPTTFMARMSWHPRWHVYVDGVEAAVRRVTPDFPAVDVAPGHHVIAFRFERPWWAHAAWLAWPLLTILAWLVTRRRHALGA
jgi:hypothetical protein